MQHLGYPLFTQHLFIIYYDKNYATCSDAVNKISKAPGHLAGEMEIKQANKQENMESKVKLLGKLKRRH